MSVGKQSFPIYSQKQLESFQHSLRLAIVSINKYIFKENQNTQLLHGKYEMRAPQVLIHQHVEKDKRKKLAGRQFTTKRIPKEALPDGLHLGQEIINKLYNQIHRNAMGFCVALDQAIYSY
jgi:hypothetical protein